MAATTGAVLDLASGPVASLYGRVAGLAVAALFFLTAVAMAVEAFGATPDQPRQLTRPVWRAVLCLAILQGYPMLAGTVAQTFTGMARSLTGPQVLNQFQELLDAKMARFKEADSARLKQEAAVADPQSGSWGGGISAAMNSMSAQAGGQIFAAILTLALLLCLGCYAVFQNLSAILLAVLYVVGPLSVVGSVLSPSLGKKWLTTFVSISTWPLISGVLLQLTAEICGVWLRSDSSSPSEILIAALSVAVIGLVTPAVASSLIGDSLGNAVSTGAGMATNAVAGLAARAQQSVVLGRKEATQEAREQARAAAMADGEGPRGFSRGEGTGPAISNSAPASTGPAPRSPVSSNPPPKAAASPTPSMPPASAPKPPATPSSPPRSSSP